MTRRRPDVGVVVCGAAIALSVVATAVVWYLVAAVSGVRGTLLTGTVLFACAPLFTALGTVIARRAGGRQPAGRDRRGGHRVGWILVGTGVALAVDAVAATAAMSHVAGAAVPLGRWTAWADDFVWAPFLLGLWLMVLLFPDGRVPDRLTRAVLWAGCAVTGLLVALVPFHSGQLIDYPGVTSPVPPVPVLTPIARDAVPVLQPAVSVMFLLVTVCVVRRYRASGPVQRAQIRWLAWWAMIFAVLITGRQFAPGSWIPALDVANGVALPLLPVVVAVAVLRYRLYEIDRLLSRTVSYALLTGCLVAVYAGVVAGVSALLHDTAGSLGVVAATLAAVSVVRPLRRLQTVVDRRFDRARHDAHRAVDGYADGLRSADPDRDHEADLLEVLDRTVAPRHAFLWTPADARPAR